MKFTIKNIAKKITSLPDEIKFNRLKEHSTSADFNDFHELAECYHKGVGTRRNYKQALKWYTKEAETGNAEAQYALGMRYWKGEKLVGGEKIEEEALKWIEKAADSGHKKAIAFIEENGVSISAKLQDKIDGFVFGKLDNAIKLIIKIQDTDKREEFVRKAITHYERTTGIQDVIPLLDYVSDQDYRVAILMKHQKSLSAQDLLKKYESEAQDKKSFKLSLAKAYEKSGDMYNASVNYFKSYNNAEIARFWIRWATMLYENKQYLEARDKVQKAISCGGDAITLKQQIEKAIKTKYSDNALEMIDKINDATDIDELDELKNLAMKSGLRDEFNEKMACFIRDAMDDVDTLEELAELEGYVNEYSLKKEYYKRHQEILKEEIEDCIDLDGLKKYSDLASEYDLEEVYNKMYAELGGNIEEQIKNANNLDKLVEIEDLAYQRDYQDLFLERLATLIDEYSDISYTFYYTKFQENETAQFMIEKIVSYMEEDYIDACRNRVMKFYEQDMDPAVWQDLPQESRTQSKCAECYIAIYDDEDLEDALEAYSSPDFEDNDIWSNNGVEDELEYLYNSVKDRLDITLVDLYEKYGKGDEETFLGVDLGDAYFEEGRQMEDDDIEKAVEYYKKAAEDYNNADAQMKLKELYEE